MISFSLPVIVLLTLASPSLCTSLRPCLKEINDTILPTFHLRTERDPVPKTRCYCLQHLSMARFYKYNIILLSLKCNHQNSSEVTKATPSPKNLPSLHVGSATCYVCHFRTSYGAAICTVKQLGLREYEKVQVLQ